MRAAYEVGNLLRSHHHFISSGGFNSWQQRCLFALSRCRTAAMGGHIDRCTNDACGILHLSYNSCRNRHCPKCQGHLREQWIQAREQELLPVGYYHVVFTLPNELNALALSQPKLIYDLLFKTAWATLDGFGKNPRFLGAKTGMIAVLHTWGSNMSLHPHLHCIVPSGGMDDHGKWKHAPRRDNFLFPVKAMSPVFRAKYVAGLRSAGINNKELYHALFSKKWMVYAKKPFGNPSSVIEYLGRYSHKIVISNHRITAIEKDTITFKVKNYRKAGQQELLTLDQEEFIRRFSLHILPKGFVRIRHYGLLSSTSKSRHLDSLQATLGKPSSKKQKPSLHLRCHCCKVGLLKTVFVFDSRGPPKHWQERLECSKKYHISKK